MPQGDPTTTEPDAPHAALITEVVLILGSGQSNEERKLGEALGIAYLEASLAELHEPPTVRLINAIFESPPGADSVEGQSEADISLNAEAWAQAVAVLHPRLVGVSLVFQGQKPWTAEFVRKLRSSGSTAFVVLGGMYPTSAWEQLLIQLPEIDAVCLGEGDLVIQETITALRDTSGSTPLPDALATRDNRGTPVALGRPSSEYGTRRPKLAQLTIEQLALLPPPTRRYTKTVVANGGAILVEASRGCNAGCRFCDARHTNWRPRPVQSVVDELIGLEAEFPNGLVYMADNIFLGFSPDGSHLDRGRDFADRLAAARLSLRFTIQDRAANVDRDTFSRLKSAGLTSVYLGLESFSQKQLLRMLKGRDATPATNCAALEILESLEIYTQFGFLPFDEGSTFGEVRETLTGLNDAIKGKNYVHFSNVNEQIPYEGTYLARQYLDTYAADPPPEDPWQYSDGRVLRVRNAFWVYSVAMWRLTIFIFNGIQSEGMQRELWRTLATKNACFINSLFWLMDLVESDAPVRELRNEIAARVREDRALILETLHSWGDGVLAAEVASQIPLDIDSPDVDLLTGWWANPDPGRQIVSISTSQLEMPEDGSP